MTAPTHLAPRSWPARSWARPLSAAAVLVASACTRPPLDATPEGVVRLFVERMEASIDDVRAMPEAIDLLGPAALANLEERARRTSLLTGKRADAREMLAPGRFGLRFRPRSIQASIDGDVAAVEVTGEGAQERTVLRCVRVSIAGRRAWRVEPDLPAVQIRKREL